MSYERVPGLARHWRLEYEWDVQKAGANLRLHGVDFNDVVAMLERPLLGFYDGAHAMDEERWVAIGWVHDYLASVVYTVRYRDEVARIISARKATKREIKFYGQYF